MNYLITILIFIIINQIIIINSVKLNRDELGELFVDNLYENIKENLLSEKIQPWGKHYLDTHFNDFLTNIELLSSKTKRKGEQIRNKRLISNLVHVNHDDGIYLLDGFHEIASIPIDFPKDLCLFQVNETLFAAGLTQNQTNQKIYLQFFKQKNDQYILIDQYQTNLATDMDCITRENKGYVAVVNIITNEKDFDPLTGSPIFEITETSIKIVQILRSINLKSIRLWTYGNDMYLMKAFNSKSTSPNTNNLVENQLCLVYKWMGFHFDIIDELQCNHPMRIEPFVIRTDIFIAIADYMDDYGSTDTFSYIYKYDFDTDKFFLMQKIKSKGAIDIKYFQLEIDNNHYEHFLIIANSINVNHNHKDKQSYEAQSVIYKYVHGSFIPSQQLQFYKIRKFLPVVGKHNEFSLLVSCENQEVQVFQYDGWQFTKSVSYSTGDVFGKGITNMRSVMINGTNIIVIANENLNTDYNNIFEPIYTFKNDLNSLQKEVMEWCEASYKIIDSYDVENYLSNIEKLSVPNNDIKYIKDIEFHNATITNIITKTLTTPTAKLDSIFFNNVSHIYAKTVYLDIKVHNSPLVDGGTRLGIIFENKTKNLDEIIKPIDELILDDLSTITKLNGFSANALLLTKNELNLNNLVLKNDSYAKGNLTVQNKIDTIKFNTTNVLLKNGYQIFIGPLRIENLFVDKLQTKLINDFPIKKSTNTESVELELNRNIKKLIVKNLTVHGLMNGWDINMLYENSLKVNENQMITGAYLIEDLYGFNLDCSYLISTHNLSNLIPIDIGSFKINQDIQFTDGVDINNLFVNHRINNIKVIDGKLDILFVDSSEKQVVYGKKIFENVKLLEPIVLTGKIKSKNFENINPIVTVDDALELNGDYLINGDVTIRKSLRSLDIYGQSKAHGVNHLQEHGLHLTSKSPYLKFNFTQAIRTNNLNVALINDRYHPNDFLRLDSNKLQKITGPVVIKNDLYIEGWCEVDTINNIDIMLLNSTILRRTGHQFIEGTIQIDEIIVDHCEADQVTIGSKHNINEYLYFPTEAIAHIIPFEITITGQLNVTNTLTIDYLTTNSKINGYDFAKMMQDTALRNQSLTVTAEKYFENDLIIENLKSKGTIFGEHLNEMENNFDDSEEIIYNGNAIFTGDHTYIDKLIVHGYINRENSEHFGENWLLTEFDQNISAKTTVDELIFQNDVTVTGKINKHDLRYIVKNCLMIDREEQLNNAVFENGIISLNNTEIHGLIGDINISDIILSESVTVQKIMKGIFVEGQIQVGNDIYIDNTINNLGIKDLKAFISPHEYNVLTEGVVINGSCTFPSEPNIEFLNDYNIDKLYQYTWMMNEGKLISVPVIFENVEVLHGIKLNGLLNGKNLTILAHNYFSLNRSQHITSNFVINGNVLGNRTVNLGDMMLEGKIRTHLSEKSVNINHYDKYSLKCDVMQIITGEWLLDEVYLFDGLPDISINGYKIHENIVFSDHEMIKITSRKIFNNLNSFSLVCPHPCVIQNVSVIDWINRAVDKFAPMNIIHGSLTIVNLQIGILNANASIENIDFYPDNILMKSTDQIINASLTIIALTDNAEDLFIEHLFASDINGLSLNFLNNIALNTEDQISINNKVVFIEPINIVNSLNMRGNIFGVNVSDLSKHNQQFLNDFKQLNGQLNFYNEISKTLEVSYSSQAYFVQHFIHRFTIVGEIIKIISICLVYNRNNDKRNFIAILEYTNNNYGSVVNFYRYSAETKAIIRDDDIHPITFNNSKIIDISRVYFNNMDMLYIESKQGKTIKHYIIGQNNGRFQHVYEFVNDFPEKLVAFRLSNQDCLLFYSIHKDSSISCIDLVHHELRLDFYQNLEKIRVKQTIFIQNNIYTSLVLLTIDGRVEIWVEDVDQKLALYQIIDVSDPISITGVFFEKFNYIAITSASINSSIYFGTIEIYRAHQNKRFYHFQTINIKLPKTIEFSVLRNGDLLLYAMTDDPISPLIIYEYAGIMGFRSFAHGAMLPKGDELTLHEEREKKKDFAIIKSNGRALFLEIVMNKKFD